MKRLSKVHKRDYKFVPKDPVDGFDPQRNKRIIDEVIEETEKAWKVKKRAYSQQLEERTDAVTMYLKNIEQGNGNTDITKYFGRKHLLYLRGQDILQKIQERLTIVKDGKVIKKAGE